MRLEAYWHNKTFPDAKSMILAALKLEDSKIPRIRAVYIGNEGPIVHTRTGGGNRESYENKESYVDGDYGLNHLIEEAKKALTNFNDYRWYISVYTEKDFDNYAEYFKVPHEAKYRFPETEEEWNDKEKEILAQIEEIEAQKKEVQETNAYTNDYLRNEFYIRDEDDDFDSTYADFFYKWPDGLENKLKEEGYLEK